VLAFFISLGAIITGHIALSQIKRTGEGGRGLAIAGLVLGYIGLVLGLFLFVLALIFPFLFLEAFGMDGTFSP
jgi:peptidyl-prolyl cis-trans isomerase B (cyclophilin B)